MDDAQAGIKISGKSINNLRYENDTNLMAESEEELKSLLMKLKSKVKSESEVAQSCPTLCHPLDCSLPGSSIHGIFQARVLEWGAIAFSGHTSYWACKVSQLMQLRDWAGEGNGTPLQ